MSVFVEAWYESYALLAEVAYGGDVVGRPSGGDGSELAVHDLGDGVGEGCSVEESAPDVAVGKRAGHSSVVVGDGECHDASRQVVEAVERLDDSRVLVYYMAFHCHSIAFISAKLAKKRDT